MVLPCTTMMILMRSWSHPMRSWSCPQNYCSNLCQSFAHPSQKPIFLNQFLELTGSTTHQEVLRDHMCAFKVHDFKYHNVKLLLVRIKGVVKNFKFWKSSRNSSFLVISTNDLRGFVHWVEEEALEKLHCQRGNIFQPF